MDDILGYSPFRSMSSEASKEPAKETATSQLSPTAAATGSGVAADDSSSPHSRREKFAQTHNAPSIVVVGED